jgi:hypothetical protein
MLKTLTEAGLTARLTPQGGLAVNGLQSLDKAKAGQLRQHLRDHRAAIVGELIGRRPSPIVAAHELVDLAQDGRLDLAWTDSGPAWSIPLEHEQADRDWITELVAEAMLDQDYLKTRINKGETHAGSEKFKAAA